MKKASRKIRTIVVLGVVLIVAAGGILWIQQRGSEDALASGDSTATAVSAGEEEEDEKEAPVPVELVAASSRDLPSYFHATGSLDALRQVDLISKAQGQITRLLVEEGDFVRANQVILEIDHRQEALLEKQARVRASTAKAELARMENMKSQGLVTEREFDEKQQNARINDFESDLAQVRLEDKIVRAPFDGRITERKIELGQTVGLGEVLVGIAEVFPLEVKLYLPEKIVAKLQKGQPVEIRPDVGGAEPLVGRVERIAPVVDPATSTIKVTLRVDEPNDSVRIGSFIRARITTDVHERAVAIPKRALVSEAGATYVFVAEADSVRKVEVETGYADDEFIELTEGVGLGESIVTVGQGGLRHGSLIRDLAKADTPEGDSSLTDSDADEGAQLADAGSR